MKPKIPIVNEQDEVIGYKDRDLITRDDIYRVAGLWITNSQGDILLAHRAFSKTHDPGKWGPAVAGTVEANETYEQNIIKEAKEELGLTGLNLVPGSKYLRRGEQWTYFSHSFRAVLDRAVENIKIDKTEVAEVRWFSKEELEAALAAQPQDFIKSVKEFIESVKKDVK